jgi:hypothetical protein
LDVSRCPIAPIKPAAPKVVSVMPALARSKQVGGVQRQPERIKSYVQHAPVRYAA